MNEIIIPAVLSGASSAFTECAINAIVNLFMKKRRSQKTEVSQIEIRKYVDDYLNKQYPNLIDYRYINDKLYEFIMSFIQYIQPQVNIQGNVVINVFVEKAGLQSSLNGFFELPENKKWNDIELLTYQDSIPVSTVNMDENSIESLRGRASRIGLQLEISNDCTSDKLEELYNIVEKYELLHKKRGN